MANSALMRFNLIDKKGNIKRPTRKLVLKKIRSALPILEWAVPYNWRENLAGDVIAGVTLAVMQVLSGNTLPALNIYIHNAKFENMDLNINSSSVTHHIFNCFRNGRCIISRCSSYPWYLLLYFSSHNLWYIWIVTTHIHRLVLKSSYLYMYF